MFGVVRVEAAGLAHTSELTAALTVTVALSDSLTVHQRAWRVPGVTGGRSKARRPLTSGGGTGFA